MSARAASAAWSPRVRADHAALEELAVSVYQRDEGNRDPEHPRGQGREPIERRLSRRVEQDELAERGEPLGIGDWSNCIDHLPCFHPMAARLTIVAATGQPGLPTHGAG